MPLSKNFGETGMGRLLFFILFFSSQWALAAVWQESPNLQWNEEWQARYSQWIEDKVNGDYFKKLGKPYSDLRLDCADAHYGLLAMFSREHGLPFAVNLGKLTNQTTQFDYISDPDSRMATFIDYLRSNFGTESLSHLDSYSPSIESIQPGDLFMWKTGSNGNFTRHTYIIKKVNKNGTFDVLYSTQANAAAGQGLKTRTNYMFDKAPTHQGNDYQYWGFRRNKWPQEAGLSQQKISDADFQQYQWAQSLSTSGFFAKVKETLATQVEKPKDELSRLLKSLCETAQERIDIVSKAIAHQKAINGQCMNFQDFDAHSTPSRDSGLMQQYDALIDRAEYFESHGQLNGVPESLLLTIELIYSNKLSASQSDRVYNYCPIAFGKKQNQKTDLNELRLAFLAGVVSYHPNDNLWWRWGFPEGPRTQCQEFYGYPQ